MLHLLIVGKIKFSARTMQTFSVGRQGLTETLANNKATSDRTSTRSKSSYQLGVYAKHFKSRRNRACKYIAVNTRDVIVLVGRTCSVPIRVTVRPLPPSLQLFEENKD